MQSGQVGWLAQVVGLLLQGTGGVRSWRVADEPMCGLPHAVLGSDQRVEDVERMLDRPMRRRATATLVDAASFLGYVAAFRTPETLLYAEQGAGRVTALLDYHQGGEGGSASWCEHRAVLQLKHSPEWAAWFAADGKSFSQGDFAEFLEERAREIVEPSGAFILELAQSLEVRRSVRFGSGINLDNGTVQLQYEETDRAGKGTVEIPRACVIGIAVFEHGVPYRVMARLRYRLREGVVTFSYHLDRPDLVLKSAFADVLGEIAVATGLTPYLGTVTVPARGAGSVQQPAGR